MAMQNPFGPALRRTPRLFWGNLALLLQDAILFAQHAHCPRDYNRCLGWRVQCTQRHRSSFWRRL
jgi:hypothetical protein